MSRAGAMVLVVALTATGLAGCLEQDKPLETPKGGDAAPSLNYTIPTLPKIDAKAFLEEHAKFVTSFPYRANNADSHVKSRDYLAKQFEAANLTVWRQKFTAGSPALAQENVCGIKLGAGDNQTWVVMGGHYDTTTWDDTELAAGKGGSAVSQGAYDDGSGTWLTVEVAKAYAKIDPYYSIVFCAFDGEERGTEGSRAVKKAMGDGGEFPLPVNSTRAVFNVDMFGINWPTRAPIYVTHSSPTVFGKIDAQRKTMGIPDDMFKTRGLVPALGSSDYGNWIRDTPTVFFISDFNDCAIPTPVPNPAPVPGVPCSYPFWHWMDTLETMTAMAGGADMSRRGFQTALDLSVFTLGQMAMDPAVKLTVNQ